MASPRSSSDPEALTLAASDENHASSAPELSPADVAARGNEITGLAIFDRTTDDFATARVEELIKEMNADQPLGGESMVYGTRPTQHLRFWEAVSSKDQPVKSPLILFVHGGSWRSGTNLDSIGSAKVGHLTGMGYAFASVNYTLIPEVTVEEQVQEVADALGFLVKKSANLDVDPTQLILMGHSSGAHVVALLGTETSYLERAGVSITSLRGVISLDGSNYNAMAELADNPGPIAENMMMGLGPDPERLAAMSPTLQARAPNALAFLLLHVQRLGDIRQAIELSAALIAAGTETALHVFEGQDFDGHIQMLLRISLPSYPATLVMDEWLMKYVPVL